MVIFGKNGQLARAWAALLPQAKAVGSAELNVADEAALKEFLDTEKPDLLLNASAYTAVDAAENDVAGAMALNAAAPAQMAAYAKANGAVLVHVSTDYVFNGSGDAPWRVTDAPDPINVYGRSKLVGEEAVLATGADALIFRTSWLFDGVGKNFLTTILRHAANKEQLSIVADQIGAPTYVPDLAKAMLDALDAALEKDAFPRGVYHLCHQGQVSWCEFAAALVAEAKAQGAELAVKEILPIPSSEYPTPAKRPHNSRLDMEALKPLLKEPMPDWKEGMKKAIREWQNEGA